MKINTTPFDLMEAQRLIMEAVRLEKEARALRERAAALMHPDETRIWTAHGQPPLPTRW